MNPMNPGNPMRAPLPRNLNNEGETPRQERTEPKESKRKEQSEIRKFASKQNPAPTKNMYHMKPGQPLPHEHKFKK